MIETVKYVRKPFFVDAIQVTAENFQEVAKWCQGEIKQNSPDPNSSKYIHVRVTNPKSPRQTKAYVGDWILYTDFGYKVYLTKAFRNAFDLVGEYQNNNPDQFSMDNIEAARENDTSVNLPEGYGAEVET